MANYEEARAKLTKTQLNKLKSVVKNKTGTTLKITRKTFKIKNYVMNYYWQYRRINENKKYFP